MPSPLIRTTVLAAGLLLHHGAAPAVAASADSAIAVSATVLSFCTIVTLPLVFGNYSAAAVNATTTVSVSCTNGTPYNLGLDPGVGGGATVAARQMTSGASTLTYSLYQDTGHTAVWGATAGSNTLPAVATGALQSFNVFGQIPAGQRTAPGAYFDTVTATITY